MRDPPPPPSGFGNGRCQEAPCSRRPAHTKASTLKHSDRGASKEEVEEEGTTGNEHYSVTLDMCRKPLNLPQFLSFKKSLKETLAHAIKGFQSPIKGRTFSQQLKDLVERDAALKHDPEIVKMEIGSLAQRADKSHAEVRDWMAKRITLLRVSVCRDNSWQGLVESILKVKDELIEISEEIKQVAEIVRDMKTGMKRQQTQARRAASHKQTKAGGVGEVLAKCMTKSYFSVRPVAPIPMSEQPERNCAPTLGRPPWPTSYSKRIGCLIRPPAKKSPTMTH